MDDSCYFEQEVENILLEELKDDVAICSISNNTYYTASY